MCLCSHLRKLRISSDDSEKSGYIYLSYFGLNLSLLALKKIPNLPCYVLLCNFAICLHIFTYMAETAMLLNATDSCSIYTEQQKKHPLI